ncbi:hypothetical protein BU17DRAFT_91907 [Hysterangium stoloniferum]|nr:hypothetical protein BU17DRAFT_91907 [Hysterangium stoloniferum]
MRDLPGFYFDTEKNRYFPDTQCRKAPLHPILAATPAGPQALQSTESLKFRKRPALDIANTAASFAKRQRSATRISRNHAQHTLHSQQLATTSFTTTIPVQSLSNSPYTSLCVFEQEIFLGDGRGVCFASENTTVSPIFSLSSPISSICASQNIIVYTSFGPRPQILISNASTRDSVILSPKCLQDVRTSYLHGNSLTLGIRNKALNIPDVDSPSHMFTLETGSDVFALDREMNEVWTGARNGSVQLFDLRINHRRDALGDRFMAHDRQTAITNLRRIHEHQLLIVAMDGTVELHDIRMIRHSKRSQPVNSLQGHVNSYTNNLGLALDPVQDFLFLVGEDLRIRAWSLRTGEQLGPPQENWNGLLARTFSEPIHGLQVTSIEMTDALWLISGSQLERYDLCRRMV